MVLDAYSGRQLRCYKNLADVRATVTIGSTQLRSNACASSRNAALGTRNA